MPDLDQIPEQDQDQRDQSYQVTGDDLSELHDLAQQLHAAGDPRAGKLWDFIAARSGGGDGNDGPTFKVYQAPTRTTSWLEDLENDLWGEAAGLGTSETAGAGYVRAGSSDASEDSSGASVSVPKDGTKSAVAQVGTGEQGSAERDKQAPNDSQLRQPNLGPGPVESNATAWNAFMQSLDSQKVGDYTVGGLANVLTNESRDLTFVGPSASLFDNDLDNAKYVQAHAIINNALLENPHAMGENTVTKAAAASTGHARDVAIMRQAYFDRMTRGVDPAKGRTYFGNSAEILTSRPIGNSRQNVFAHFGPFRWGSHSPQFIYIYDDPLEKK